MSTFWRSNMSKVELFVWRCTFVLALILFSTVGAHAVELDITAFGGVQRQGKLTLRSAPSTSVSLIRTINSTNFGIFGARIGHGRIFGGEHTVAFSPNF